MLSINKVVALILAPKKRKKNSGLDVLSDMKARHVYLSKTC